MLTDLQNGWQRLSETDHIVSDEEISAIERNKSEKNKNRKGADIPGLFIGSMKYNVTVCLHNQCSWYFSTCL